MSKELRIALQVGKSFGVDEALPMYTSKIDVKEWVGLKHLYDNADGCTHQLSSSKTRSILQEYKRALLVVGKNAEQFKEAVVAIEKELRAHGYYKAFALLTGPCELCQGVDLSPEVSRRPSLALMSIDIVATVRRFKKNEPVKQDGTIAPHAIILIE